jgi:hypothetical protein
MDQGLCVPSANVTASLHERGMVLMDVSRGRLFAANLTGARIWRALELRQPLGVIAAGISRRHGIPLAEAEMCTAQFVAALAAQNLISTVDA